MKKSPFYLKIISFILLILIWDYIFINYRDLPLSIPIHSGWDGNPDFFVPRIMIWFLAGIATFIYLLIFYLTKNINSSMLEMSKNTKDNTNKTERFVSILHLIIMLKLTVITYVSIAVGFQKYENQSPVLNYLIFVLFLGVIAIMIYSYMISRKYNSLKPINECFSIIFLSVC